LLNWWLSKGGNLAEASYGFVSHARIHAGEANPPRWFDFRPVGFDPAPHPRSSFDDRIAPATCRRAVIRIERGL